MDLFHPAVRACWPPSTTARQLASWRETASLARSDGGRQVAACQGTADAQTTLRAYAADLPTTRLVRSDARNTGGLRCVLAAVAEG